MIYDLWKDSLITILCETCINAEIYMLPRSTYKQAVLVSLLCLYLYFIQTKKDRATQPMDHGRLR